MIDILVIAHAGLAKEFCQVATGVLGAPDLHLFCIGADWQESREEIATKIRDFFAGGHGSVLILTDLYGSTHANLCMPYLAPGRVEMIAGLNPPLLLKALSLKNTLPLSALTQALVTYGRTHVRAVEDI